MCAFNSAAIFYPGHPYIESTTVLSDTHMYMVIVVVGTKPELAAVGSATVAVLSQSSGIERPFSLP